MLGPVKIESSFVRWLHASWNLARGRVGWPASPVTAGDEDDGRGEEATRGGAVGGAGERAAALGAKKRRAVRRGV